MERSIQNCVRGDTGRTGIDGVKCEKVCEERPEATT